MNLISDWLFQQYAQTPAVEVILEIIGVIFGFLSVLFAKKGDIKVYPTGIISTIIFVYLLWINGLFGDMIINAYYTMMSVYGWILWAKNQTKSQVKISVMSASDWRTSLLISVGSIIGIFVVYWLKYTHATEISFDEIPLKIIDYFDIFTTAIFFVGMWLMAQRKIENWIFWIIGDVVSVFLYYYKGLIFSSFQYLIFTLIAVWAYREWKQIYSKQIVI